MLKTKHEKDLMVRSPLGMKKLDNTGAAVGAARMDPAQAYGAVPLLLKEYIATGSDKIWQEIKRRIDNIYLAVSAAMDALEAAEPFSKEVVKALESGRRLFFKPNLVTIPTMDFTAHDAVLYGCSLPWEFLAPVMRWFHDRLGVTYHQMAMGEAATNGSASAVLAAKAWGTGPVSTLAVMEGKYGNHYGGWGFYFARRYLAESHDRTHTDDPMNGYEESLLGACLPPGQARDKLLIYDLNKIAGDFCNGREVTVPDGVNYRTISMHKVITGGDPEDPEDLRDWPGCYLVNVAKLKIHVLELFTCAIKNLGIGLYPMEVADNPEPGKCRWKYAVPHLQVPMFKMSIPHSRWVAGIDIETGNPVRDKDGNYYWTKTGGMQANMADVLQAVKSQNVPMIHVADAIETVNIHHSGPGCQAIPEGLVFASNDIVAIDACASRYLFTMAPMAETDSIREKYGLTSDVIQEVPLPEIEGNNIVNRDGYDSPFARYEALQHCEHRGIGQQRYYITGQDLWQGGGLASLNQHLGRVDGEVFSELLTRTLYHTPNKTLQDLQTTSLAYLKANDELTGSNFYEKFRQTFDENGDGVIDYLETGRGEPMLMVAYNFNLSTQDIDPLEGLRLRFLISAGQLRRIRKEWNTGGHDIGGHGLLMQSLAMAFSMSKAKEEKPDPLFPGRVWGNGKWPSFQLAMQRQLASRMYGLSFPDKVDVLMSPYGQAFSYADAKWNGGKYRQTEANPGNSDPIGNYYKAVASGAAQLPFKFYVPQGFGKSDGISIPNVEETDDPKLLFSAVFANDEVWRDLKLSSFNLK